MLMFIITIFTIEKLRETRQSQPLSSLFEDTIGTGDDELDINNNDHHNQDDEGDRGETLLVRIYEEEGGGGGGEEGTEDDGMMSSRTSSHSRITSVSSLLAMKREKIEKLRQQTIEAANLFSKNTKKDSKVNSMRTLAMIQGRLNSISSHVRNSNQSD
jgi:hypothetical protein